MENLKEIPSWIVPQEDGKFEITIKDKKYIMQEKIHLKLISKCIFLKFRNIYYLNFFSLL